MQNNRKLIYVTLMFFFMLGIILAMIVFYEKNSPLKIVFFDVGQGDAALISQGDQQLLIDGGKDGKVLLEKLGKYVPFWDRNIEAILETHPDQDHIGGLIDVLNTYNVDFVLETKMQSDSQTFKKLEETIMNNKIEKIEAKKGVVIKFSNGSEVQILYPFESIVDVKGEDTNSYSVIAKLINGEDRFFFAGDLPMEKEKQLLENNIEVEANFLKVAHHGSKYATSNEFLEKIKPTEAVISVGKNNSYGHPNPEVLQRLLRHKVSILRTDEIGDIVYECRNTDSRCILKVAN